jgi:hypothetical protein
MVYEGYNEGFINKLITGEARVVSDKNWGLLQPRIGISSYQPKKTGIAPRI